MEFNDYHCYINLEKRATRKKQCEKQLKSIGIHKPRRFNAIENENGFIGCAQSHIECLKIARDENWPYICIFEDDLLFNEPNKVKEMINKYIDYELLNRKILLTLKNRCQKFDFPEHELEKLVLKILKEEKSNAQKLLKLLQN